MAVGKVIPRNVAGDLATLATALDAKPNISAAVVVPSQGNVDEKRHHVKVTGTAVSDVNAAVLAEVRKVDRGTSSGGTFTLTIDGDETGNIAYDATAGAVETAVEAVDAVSALVSVTGTGSAGDPWIITFADGEGAVVTGDDTNLTGGDSTITVTSPVANVQFLPGTTVA